MELINTIFRYEFLQNAYLIGILIGVIGPVLGTYVVVRRLSVIVDGISHISVAGVAFSFLIAQYGIEVPNFVMAVIFAIVGGIIIEVLSSSFKDFKEVSVPILISFSTALMIFFAGFANGFNSDLNSYLFGNILTATKFEVYLLFFIAIIFFAFIYKNFYSFIAFAIDEQYCKFNNINAKGYKWFMMIVISVVIAVSIKAVGMMLVGALVVLPVTTAIKLANSFKNTLIYSIIFSEISVISGLTIAYYLNISSGATIIFMNLLMLLLVSIFVKIKNIS